MFLLTLTIFAQQNMRTGNEMSVLFTDKDADLQWEPCPPFMPEGCSIAVLHGDPVKRNLDVFFKVPANSDIPNHWHHSAERMILISGELHVTYKGENTQIMKAGSYAYGPSTKPHIAKCVNSEPCVLFIAFEEPLDAFPLIIKE
ncbi:MAG: cupin domain-containing protein [Flavobacteriaceae bacterium]|nr:cupin domain-containing protein [Flavobacteriaceae bacterium]